MGVSVGHSTTYTSDMAAKVLFSALVAIASSAPAGPPAAYPVEPVYPDLPPVYNYNYGVNDPEYSGAVFSHSENRENYAANGEYRVNLPDSRVQIVTYTAGPEGYVADVKYEGEAAYPDLPAPAYKPAPVVVAPAPYKPVVVAPAPYKPVIVKPAAVYHPAPVYHSAPVYHKPSGYKPSLINPAYTPKKYGFTIVANEEAVPKEIVVEEPAPVVPAPVEPAPVVPAPVEPATPIVAATIEPAAPVDAAPVEPTVEKIAEVKTAPVEAAAAE